MNKLLLNFDLKNVIYSRLSSKVKYYFEVDNLDFIRSQIKRNDVLFIGNSSKILYAFDYKDCMVIKYTKNDIKIYENYLIVDSGCSLFKLGNFAIEHEINGFEKIMTIPGLVGGSLINNVSFLNQCISDNLFAIEIIDNFGNVRILYKNEIDCFYRKIKIKYEKYFIFKAIFRIDFATKNELKLSKEKAFRYRKEKQPNILSLGSTFKNIDNFKAYKLIEDNISFKGYGGFLISDKHKNFIEINKDLDKLNLVKLIERIQEVLYNKVGLFLETEIIIVY